MRRSILESPVIAVLAAALGAASCAKAPQLHIGEPRPIDWRGWESRSVTSQATGEKYGYLYHPAGGPGAPRMVLLHGFSLDSRTYINMADLASGYEMYAPDFPGESSLYGGGQADLALAIKDFADSLGLDRFVLAGTSLGGITAMEFFKHKGETRVEALVLISSVVLDATEKDKRNRIRAARLMSKRSDSLLLKLMALGINKSKKKQDKNGGAKDAQHDVFNIIGLKPAAFYRQVMGLMLHYDGDPGAKLVGCPTLVIHGSEDQTIPVEKAAVTVARIPQAEIEIVKGAGHDGVFTEGEEFARIIGEWLEASLPAQGDTPAQ